MLVRGSEEVQKAWKQRLETVINECVRESRHDEGRNKDKGREERVTEEIMKVKVENVLGADDMTAPMLKCGGGAVEWTGCVAWDGDSVRCQRIGEGLLLCALCGRKSTQKGFK